MSSIIAVPRARTSADPKTGRDVAKLFNYIPEDRARAAQGHMLPGPRLVALIAFEGFDRHHEHALGPFGPQAGIDFIERTCCRRYAERGGHAAREAIEIVVWSEGFRTV